MRINQNRQKRQAEERGQGAMDMDDNVRARESDDLIEEKQDNEGQLELDLEPEITPDDPTPQWTTQRFCSRVCKTGTINGVDGQAETRDSLYTDIVIKAASSTELCILAGIETESNGLPINNINQDKYCVAYIHVTLVAARLPRIDAMKSSRVYELAVIENENCSKC